MNITRGWNATGFGRQIRFLFYLILNSRFPNLKVSLHYTQVNGIFTGWKHGVERSLNAYETDISDLFWLNSIAEVPELQRKLNISIENTTLDNLPHLSSAFLRVVNKTADEGVLKMFLAQNSAGRYFMLDLRILFWRKFVQLISRGFRNTVISGMLL